MKQTSADPFVWHVEDSDGDAYLVVKALSQCGHSTRIGRAIDGRDAMETLRAIQEGSHEVPDLVLLDLKLPFISGLELLQFMREQESLSSIPVVVFTSSDEQRDIDAARAAGCHDYYVKPIDYTLFRENVKEICDRYLSGSNDFPGDSVQDMRQVSLAS